MWSNFVIAIVFFALFCFLVYMFVAADMKDCHRYAKYMTDDD